MTGASSRVRRASQRTRPGRLSTLGDQFRHLSVIGAAAESACITTKASQS